MSKQQAQQNTAPPPGQALRCAVMAAPIALDGTRQRTILRPGVDGVMSLTVSGGALCIGMASKSFVTTVPFVGEVDA